MEPPLPPPIALTGVSTAPTPDFVTSNHSTPVPNTSQLPAAAPVPVPPRSDPDASLPSLLPSTAAKRADLVALKTRLASLLPPQDGHLYWNALVDFFQGKINRQELGQVVKRVLGTTGEAGTPSDDTSTMSLHSLTVVVLRSCLRLRTAVPCCSATSQCAAPLNLVQYIPTIFSPFLSPPRRLVQAEARQPGRGWAQAARGRQRRRYQRTRPEATKDQGHCHGYWQARARRAQDPRAYAQKGRRPGQGASTRARRATEQDARRFTGFARGQGWARWTPCRAGRSCTRFCWCVVGLDAWSVRKLTSFCCRAVARLLALPPDATVLRSKATSRCRHAQGSHEPTGVRCWA